jgi:thiol-disulfide isomerase/thioredoxin
MEDLLSIEQFDEFIETNEAVLVYFSTPQCNVCKILKPKLEELISDEFPKIKMAYVNSELLPEVAAQQRIFTVPTVVVFLDRKEFIRKSRNISLSEFQKDIHRPYSLYFDE